MKTSEGVIILEDIDGLSDVGEGIQYRDVSGTKIYISAKIIIHLYDHLEYVANRRGLDWKAYCNSTFRGL